MNTQKKKYRKHWSDSEESEKESNYRNRKRRASAVKKSYKDDSDDETEEEKVPLRIDSWNQPRKNILSLSDCVSHSGRVNIGENERSHKAPSIITILYPNSAKGTVKWVIFAGFLFSLYSRFVNGMRIQHPANYC